MEKNLIMADTQSDPGTVRLSLTVATGARCFDLVEDESKLGPEDWAWRFLRLSLDYQMAYGRACAKIRDNLGPKPPEIAQMGTAFIGLNRKVSVDEQLCRDRFGLSAWLDPNLIELPMLNDEGSWFAPLKSIVAEPRFDALKPNPFGYRVVHKYLEHRAGNGLSTEGRPAEFERASGRQPWMDATVWFAVDCSVPPDGQIATIHAIARQYALEMREGQLTASAFYYEQPEVCSLPEYPPFSEVSLPKARAATSVGSNDVAVWRLAKISLIGPVSQDIKECRALLQKEHEAIVASNLAKKPFQQRFRPFLDGTREGVGMDGSTLKAYLTIAEFLAKNVTKSSQIISELAKRGAGESGPGGKSGWLADQFERTVLFDAHAKRAKAYVDEGYKWLVHSQNPPID